MIHSINLPSIIWKKILFNRNIWIISASCFPAKEVNSLVSFFSSGLLASAFSFSLGSIVGLGKDSLVIVMEFSQFGIINFRPLDDFNFSNPNVFNRVDSINFTGNLLFDNFRSEQVEDLGGVGFCDFFGNHLIHSASDFLLLGTQSIVGLLLLVGGFTSKGNRENSDNISISRSAVLNAFNEGFTFLNKSAKLISSHVDSVETAESISSSGFIDNQTDFSPGEVILVGSKVSLAASDDTASDAVFDFTWNKIKIYGDLEFCWRRCSQMTQLGKERGLWVGTTLFWREGRQLSSSVPSCHSFSYFFLEPWLWWIITFINIQLNIS